MNKIKYILAAVIFSFLINTIHAASLPSYYPKKFARSGVISSIAFDKQSIVIGDQHYIISDALIVHNLTSVKVSSLSSLKIGMNVGLMKAGKNSLLEVWVLPEGYDQDYIDVNDD